MKEYKLIRTVSVFNDETDDILTYFKDCYPNGEVSVLEENHISGVVTETLKLDNKLELITYLSHQHCLVNECFTVLYKDDVILEEHMMNEYLD